MTQRGPRASPGRGHPGRLPSSRVSDQVTPTAPWRGLWVPPPVEEVKNASPRNQARPQARVLGLGRLLQNLVADVRV